MLSTNSCGRRVVEGCVAAISMEGSVDWGVLGRQGRIFINLSRLRLPVGLGAITRQVDMGVQRKGCRPHYPVRNER